MIVGAIGSSLSRLGRLADPILDLRDGNSALVRSNDNWRSDQEAEIIATTIPARKDLESDVAGMLPSSGAVCTAIVRGMNGRAGVVIVEVSALN